MDQNWFYRGNALIHSLSEQETTSLFLLQSGELDNAVDFSEI